MRYIDLLHSVISNAQRGLTDERALAVQDALAIADTLFPIVSQGVCEAAAADEYKRELLRRQKTLTFVAGEAAITSDILQNYIWDSTLINGSFPSRRYAFRQYEDFIRRGDQRIGIYSIRGQDTFVLCDPNVPFTVPLTSSGARILNTPCVVEKPALATDDIDCPFQILSDLDEALANSLRGQIIKQASQAA